MGGWRWVLNPDTDSFTVAVVMVIMIATNLCPLNVVYGFMRGRIATRGQQRCSVITQLSSLEKVCHLASAPWRANRVLT